MKIGILTQPIKSNYGGILQNYALQKVIKNNGFEVITLDWNNKKQPMTLRLFLGRLKGMLYSIGKKKVTKDSNSYMDFVDKYICKSRIAQNSNDLLSITLKNNLDAIIVGSDQCWRPKYVYPMLEDMFLRFAKNLKDLKRIAYAVSFGTNEWEYTKEQTKECSELLQKFDLVTVRENTGVKLCKNYLHSNASHVLDPTMLLQKEDYIRLVEENQVPESPGNLYYYILDSKGKIFDMIKNIADNTGLEPFFVAQKGINISSCPGVAVVPSILAWIRGFMDARMTIVDSFHGAVFSIIFNKPFWVIGNKTRGMSRFESLLGMFGLEERLIDESEMSKIDVERSINWDEVNTRINSMKEESLALLFSCLENE